MLRYSASELKPCCIEHVELSFHISAAEACWVCIFHQEFYIGNWTKLCAREDSPSGKEIPYFCLVLDPFKWLGLYDRLSGDDKKISISAGFFFYGKNVSCLDSLSVHYSSPKYLMLTVLFSSVMLDS